MTSVPLKPLFLRVYSIWFCVLEGEELMTEFCELFISFFKPLFWFRSCFKSIDILYQLCWNAIHTSSAVFYSKPPTVDSLYMNYVQWSQKEGKGACVGSDILDPCSQISSSILIWFSWTCSVTQTLQCNLIQLLLISEAPWNPFLKTTQTYETRISYK